MAIQKARYSLESVVRGLLVYKYIWTAWVGERLSLRTDMGNAHDSYHTMYAVSVIKMWDCGPHTENHLLSHDCPFRVTSSDWKLQIARYRGAWLRYKAHPPNKGCVVHDKTMRLTDEYVLNSEVCLTSRLYGMYVCMMLECKSISIMCFQTPAEVCAIPCTTQGLLEYLTAYRIPI